MPSGLTGREAPLPPWQPAPGPLAAILGGRAAKGSRSPWPLHTPHPLLAPCRLPVPHSWFLAQPLEELGRLGAGS